MTVIAQLAAVDRPAHSPASVMTAAAVQPDAAEAASPPPPSSGDALLFPTPVLARGQLLFRTLGSSEIHVGHGPVIGPSAERSFALLVLCAMTPDHVLPRAQLLDLVWPDLDEDGARHSLRQHLYKLRQYGIPLRATRITVTLDPACLVPSFALGRTAELFDRDVLRGQEPFGHLFAGWVPSHEGMRLWVEQQRDRYHMDVRRILMPELRRLRDRGDWVECERWARTVLEFDPYNEDATLVLAEAIAMLGNRVSARYMLDGYVRETGLAGTELVQQVEATQRRIGRASRLQHEHAATPTLIGRDEELARLDALTLAAMQGETQLVRIVGPPGIGKTELAYEATRRAVILGFARCIVRVTRPMGEVPYGMLSRLVRDLLKLPGALGCKPEVRSQLVTFSTPSQGEQSLEASRVPTALSEAIADLVLSVAEEQPLLVFVDDVEDADEASLAHLDSCIDLSKGRSVFWLFSDGERESRRAALLPHRTTESELLLGPLAHPSRAALANAVRTPTGRQLSSVEAEAIAGASDGNPRGIVLAARRWLAEGIAELPEGRSITAIGRETDALSQSTRVLLQALALLGGKAAQNLLDDCLAFSIDERLDAIRSAVRLGLVNESSGAVLSMTDSVAKAILSRIGAAERQVLTRHIVRVSLEGREWQHDSALAQSILRLSEVAEDPGLFVRTVLAIAPRLIERSDGRSAVPYLQRAIEHAESREEKAQLLGWLVVAAQHSSDWHRILEAEETKKKSASAVQIRTFAPSLAKVEARLRVATTSLTTQHATETLNAIESDRSSPQERIRACRIALGIASDTFDPQLARLAFDWSIFLADEHPSCTTESDECALQFHTIFGELDTAVELAQTVLTKALDREPDEIRIRFALNAAYALRVGGRLRDSAHVLERLLCNHAVQQSLGRRSYACWQLALIGIDEGKVSQAVFWTSRLVQLSRVHDAIAEEAWLKLHLARVQLLTSGVLADPEFVLGHGLAARNGPTRSSVYATALALHCSRQRERVRLPGGQLDTAREYFERFSRFAGQDVIAAGLVADLVRNGREPEARALGARYLLELRRERFRPHSFFAMIPDATFVASLTDE